MLIENTAVKRIKCLSGNTLKIIAAVTMLIDHIGFILLPQYGFLRIIGRLSFPIFAFLIAEGCKYTKNKLRYFLSVFILGLVCQIAYYVAAQSLYIGVLLSFSVSILCVYALEYMKKVHRNDGGLPKKILAVALFALSLVGAYVFNVAFNVDYGFLGCMLPVFASIIADENDLPKVLKNIDVNTLRVFLFGICLLAFAIYDKGNSYYSLLSLPVLLLYSEKRGKLKMKYFFYIFYPAHLAAIYGIDLILK